MERSWRENTIMKGKKTAYKGIIFKSKLEATWAYYFDCIGIEWKYEPRVFRSDTNLWYKPDFFLPQIDLWAEVKCDNDLTQKELAKIKIVMKQTRQRCILLDGEPRQVTFELFSLDENDNIIRGNDCVVSMYHNYPITEHRFYENSGFKPGHSAEQYNNSGFRKLEKLVFTKVKIKNKDNIEWVIL